jgi:hypothetical protein
MTSAADLASAVAWIGAHAKHGGFYYDGESKDGPDFAEALLTHARALGWAPPQPARSCVCKVCGNSCADGEINHGRGCYVVSSDGGGTVACDCAPSQSATLPREVEALAEAQARHARFHREQADFFSKSSEGYPVDSHRTLAAAHERMARAARAVQEAGLVEERDQLRMAIARAAAKLGVHIDALLSGDDAGVRTYTRDECLAAMRLAAGVQCALLDAAPTAANLVTPAALEHLLDNPETP